MRWLREHAALLCLALISLILHFYRLGDPHEIVFDESLFGKYAAAYFSHRYYFDIHPPHTKLIYALLAYLGGMDPSFQYPGPDTPYPGNFYVVMRALPAFAGSMLPLIVYGLCRELGVTRVWALTAGWFVLFDSALMAMSRFTLTDMLLVTYGTAAWLAFALWCRKDRWIWLFLASLLIGLATSVKWTGLAYLAPIGLVLLYRLRRSPPAAKTWVAMVCFALIPIAWQLLGFVIHLSLLTHSGIGDDFMSPEFQKSLIGNPHAAETGLADLSMMDRVIELNRAMARYAGQDMSHPYGSKWYTWPLGWRGIYFWTDHGTDRIRRIYMVPNLIVWWIASFGMLYLLVNLVPRALGKIMRIPGPAIDRVELLIALAYLAFLLPFVPIHRVMFLYHYFPAFIISIIATARLASAIPDARKLAIPLVVIAGLGFAHLAPLVYGWPLSDRGFDARMWLSSWL
jgi:dolichyl-phosphate-mannose--protein O-mannosyl transferase